jgi:hypothetical protein
LALLALGKQERKKEEGKTRTDEFRIIFLCVCVFEKAFLFFSLSVFRFFLLFFGTLLSSENVSIYFARVP